MQTVRKGPVFHMSFVGGAPIDEFFHTSLGGYVEGEGGHDGNMRSKKNCGKGAAFSRDCVPLASERCRNSAHAISCFAQFAVVAGER
jgi:hypothetical protein